MSKRHRFKFGRIKLFIIIIAGVYVLFAIPAQQSEMAAQRERRAELLREQERLELEAEYRENELDFIGSDEYVEQEARQRLGWLKPGEIKYVDSSQAEPAYERPSESGDTEVTPEHSVEPAEESPEPSPTPRSIG